MINAMVARNIAEKVKEEKKDILLQIDKAINVRANSGETTCIYEIYPDCPMSIKEIVSTLEKFGFKVSVIHYEESDLDFEADYCDELFIEW